MKIVISLGGSLVFKEGIDEEYVKKFASFVSGLHVPVAVSVGGGKIAREYVEKGRALGANNFELDEISIELVRANARLVASAIEGSLYFENFDDAKNHFGSSRSVILLGVGSPGQTSDTVSVLFAEETEATKWINLSNVDAIYDRDPKKKGAKKFSLMTHKELLSFADKNDTRKPRENFIIDSLAAKILARSNIEAHFIDGNDFGAFEKALLGKPHGGTVVKN